MIYTNTFAQYEKLLHQKYEVSSTIRHKGERGRQRENGLLSFLSENLPSAYGVASGEIIPYKGKIPSPQCDIIIYDRLRMPVLGRNDIVQQVPLEAVYAVIECKSLVDTKALRETKVKIDAIRLLPRCPSIRPLKKDMDSGPFFVLFGYRMKSSFNKCTQFMKQSAVDKDVQAVVLNNGCGIWLEDYTEPVWIKATELKSGQHETLLLFFISLLQALVSIDLGEPSFLELFYSGQ